MTIQVYGQTRERSKRQERKSVQVRLAREDWALLNAICSQSGRSYGEQVALWLQERKFQDQMAKQEAR